MGGVFGKKLSLLVLLPKTLKIIILYQFVIAIGTV